MCREVRRNVRSGREHGRRRPSIAEHGSVTSRSLGTVEKTAVVFVEAVGCPNVSVDPIYIRVRPVRRHVSMSLDVAAAIEDGLGRLPTRVAALLGVAYLAVGVSSTVTSQTLALAVTDALRAVAPAASTAAVEGAGGPLALGLGLPVAAALFLVQIVAAQAVGVVAIRTFVADARRSLPAGVTRRFAWVVLNALVAGFVVNVLIGLGVMLLIVPGIYLAVALYFVQFEVIVEGKNALDALRDGWALTAGDRLRVFLLLVALVAVGLASAVPAFVLDLAGVPSLVSTGITVVLGAAISVFSVAVGARAYVQLKPDGWSSPDGTPSPLAD